MITEKTQFVSLNKKSNTFIVYKYTRNYNDSASEFNTFYTWLYPTKDY